MAHAALRRRADRPTGPGPAGADRRLAAVVRRVLRGPRHARLRLHRDGRGRWRGQPDQPVLRDLLRAAVGRLRARLAALRAGYKAISPVRTINAAVRQAHRQRPRHRACSPTPSGWATGPRRWASTRSCGWSWSTRSRPSSARCGCGARSYVAAMLLGGALFGNTFYEHADPFEVFSTLVVPDVGVGAAGQAAGGPQPAGEPRHHAGRARAGRGRRRCCSAAPRSTRSRTRRGG